jgi:hypothetical protein
MKRINRVANSTGDELRRTQNRMYEIVSLITPTQEPDARIEWSALMCTSAMVMSTSAGIETTSENLSEIMALIASEVAPAVEKLVREMKARA